MSRPPARPAGTLRIEELVQQLSHEFTVVIVTHNLQQAARVSEYTAFFYWVSDRTRPHGGYVHRSARPTHRSVRDRPVRMTATTAASTPLGAASGTGAVSIRGFDFWYGSESGAARRVARRASAGGERR